jgi:hypothetical protein
MYFELTVDPFFEGFSIDRPDDIPWDLTLINGSSITHEIEIPFEFKTNAVVGDVLPDFWSRGFPAMSKRFVSILEASGVDNLQKFPAVVKSEKDGTLWEGYYLVNILGLIQCADLSRSKYTEIFPGSFKFDELAIDAEKTKGALLFRLQECPYMILIHKSVGKHIMLSDPDETLVGWDVNEIVQ